jgi:hypothetical protein
MEPKINTGELNEKTNLGYFVLRFALSAPAKEVIAQPPDVIARLKKLLAE